MNSNDHLVNEYIGDLAVFQIPLLHWFAFHKFWFHVAALVYSAQVLHKKLVYNKPVPEQLKFKEHHTKFGKSWKLF